jgi:hypothetical protein
LKSNAVSVNLKHELDINKNMHCHAFNIKYMINQSSITIERDVNTNTHGKTNPCSSVPSSFKSESDDKFQLKEISEEIAFSCYGLGAAWKFDVVRASSIRIVGGG